ncbi:MAG: hypothetical protein IKU15_09255 [Clostridia bacterium]|nr:hypothetical protein [Clostridia bacterium]
MNTLKIKDLYVGKPDAKDEIGFDGVEGFVNSVVIPETFNIDGLLHKDACFITGYKGTGKTALLFYLDYSIREKDPCACCSFIFFKDEFTEAKKREMESYSKRILSSITFGNEILLNNTDFEHIWRWLFFKRIVSDNEEYSDNLFVNNKEWEDFKNIVDKIKAPIDKKRSIIPEKLKLAVPVKDPYTQTEIAPSIEVDFSETKENENYLKFVELLDEAEEKLGCLTRTDVPYFIFVDELEAYYGDQQVFKRDLCFIRDLIFTVKRLNGIFKSFSTKTKVICSARTEIINAIFRFTVSKEMNKVTGGFEVPLIWNYSNTTSYYHPIIQVLLKRIYMCEDLDELDYKDIYNRWFPEKIHDIEPANYILNNGWNKPRDIVRLIYSAQNSIKCNETVFNQAVFDAIRKKYSSDSLAEIKEEMRALYTTENIDTIVTCFTGFKTIFSVNQLKERVKQYYSDSVIDIHFTQVLQDLYRLGFIGNYLPSSKTYRWQHKGDEGLIISDEWRFIVHYALHSALSLSGKQDYGFSQNAEPETGDMVNVVVTGGNRYYALVEFERFGRLYKGSIFCKNLNMGYVNHVLGVVNVGDEYRAQILDYNEQHKRWNLTLDFEHPKEE